MSPSTAGVVGLLGLEVSLGSIVGNFRCRAVSGRRVGWVVEEAAEARYRGTALALVAPCIWAVLGRVLLPIPAHKHPSIVQAPGGVFKTALPTTEPEAAPTVLSSGEMLDSIGGFASDLHCGKGQRLAIEPKADGLRA